MRDLRNIARRRNDRAAGSDRWSEFMAYLVMGWLVAVVLLPLHALLIWFSIFTSSPFPLAVMFLLMGVPLLAVDWWLFNWFRDNISVFRWTDRESRGHGGNGSRR